MDANELSQIRRRAEAAREITQPISAWVDWYIDEAGELSALHSDGIDGIDRLAVIGTALAADVLALAAEVERLAGELKQVKADLNRLY